MTTDLASHYTLTALTVLDTLPDELRATLAATSARVALMADAAMRELCPDPDDVQGALMLVSATVAAVALADSTSPAGALTRYAATSTHPGADPTAWHNESDCD
jgi:hypothetical protein